MSAALWLHQEVCLLEIRLFAMTGNVVMLAPNPTMLIINYLETIVLHPHFGSAFDRRLEI